MSERLDNTLAGDAPASYAGAPSSAALPRIALLYADDALLAHVEQTLAAMRVPVVYRAAIEQAEATALAAANSEIALINLDDRCGERLDTLTAMLDTAGVPIVFNDADISKGLEGWARARWARHLCAKLCGKNDVDPPRPTTGAVAQSAEGAVAEAPSEPVVEASVPIAASSDQPSPVAEPVSAARPLSQGEIDSLLADFPSDAAIAGADTQALSAQVDALLANVAEHTPHEPAPWEVVGFADDSEQPASAKAEAPVAAAAKPAVAASADQWQLVDDFIPVASAPREAKAAAPTANFASGLALELEPLEPVVAPTPLRDSGPGEMRLDGKPPKGESGK